MGSVMWEMVKEVAHGIFYLWWGGWTLFVFTWIGLFGEMRAVEPTHWILIIEYITCATAIVLGVERLQKDVLKLKIWLNRREK